MIIWQWDAEPKKALWYLNVGVTKYYKL
jgi:hypothetical protein